MSLGATGRKPEGSIHPRDEGELQMGVAADKAHGCVIVNFGTPVAWIGISADQARELARMLNAKADEVSGRPQ